MNAPGLQKERFMALRETLPALLPDFLRAQRWFGGKARAIRRTEVFDVLPFGSSESDAFIVLARVEYDAGPSDTYVLPLVVLAETDEFFQDALHTLRVKCDGGQNLILGDALRNEKFLLGIHAAIDEQRIFRGLNGDPLHSRAVQLE